MSVSRQSRTAVMSLILAFSHYNEHHPTSTKGYRLHWNLYDGSYRHYMIDHVAGIQNQTHTSCKNNKVAYS